MSYILSPIGCQAAPGFSVPTLVGRLPTFCSKPALTAFALDRLADLALAEGRHQRAETFSIRAAEMREGGR